MTCRLSRIAALAVLTGFVLPSVSAQKVNKFPDAIERSGAAGRIIASVALVSELGLPKEFGGVVYDTASVGIMHALAVAREEAAPSTRKLGLTGRNLPRFRIYTSDQAHSSVEKAAIALGLGEENVQRVPSDTEFRMDVAALSAMIALSRSL